MIPVTFVPKPELTALAKLTVTRHRTEVKVSPRVSESWYMLQRLEKFAADVAEEAKNITLNVGLRGVIELNRDGLLSIELFISRKSSPRKILACCFVENQNG